MESLQEQISRLNLRISELHSKNAALRHENEILKRGKPMYSEENERLAEAAYNQFRANHDATLPVWGDYAPKHVWRDLVETFARNPRSHVAVANPMEQCVSDVLLAKAEGAIPVPASIPKPVAEPVEPKPAKAAKKK